MCDSLIPAARQDPDQTSATPLASATTSEAQEPPESSQKKRRLSTSSSLASAKRARTVVSPRAANMYSNPDDISITISDALQQSAVVNMYSENTFLCYGSDAQVDAMMEKIKRVARANMEAGVGELLLSGIIKVERKIFPPIIHHSNEPSNTETDEPAFPKAGNSHDTAQPTASEHFTNGHKHTADKHRPVVKEPLEVSAGAVSLLSLPPRPLVPLAQRASPADSNLPEKSPNPKLNSLGDNFAPSPPKASKLYDHQLVLPRFIGASLPSHSGRNLAEKQNSSAFHGKSDLITPPFFGNQDSKKEPPRASHVKMKGQDWMRRDGDNSEVICGNCGEKGHGLADCIWPDDTGFIDGCPLCNTREHSAGKCPRSCSGGMERCLLLMKRAKKPPIACEGSWVWLLHGLSDRSRSQVTETGLPWTSGFTKDLIHLDRDVSLVVKQARLSLAVHLRSSSVSCNSSLP
ncbi:hypothetical protein CTRI78_v006157 [Colletotrichum trifolii]|uniref:CCHC-type domain-containing protein n=1 Tax=Colletotrichum trifolii TaxID=5466 RepID=A0A4R8RD11_COLTR|nr:hypothetical protein CTRI78_v006157 [Colletotrichum trifolii]